MHSEINRALFTPIAKYMYINCRFCYIPVEIADFFTLSF
jgi:hypothetical protein